MVHNKFNLLDAKFDRLFKAIVIAGWCVKSSGDVESNPGYFSLTEIPSHQGERAAMQDAVINEYGATEDFEVWGDLNSGWYITVEENQGMIFVYKMDDQQSAEVEYAALEALYADWCEDENDELDNENLPPMNQLGL